MFRRLQQRERARVGAGGEMTRRAVEASAGIAACRVRMIRPEQFDRLRDEAASVLFGGMFGYVGHGTRRRGLSLKRRGEAASDDPPLDGRIPQAGHGLPPRR
jgi:hypothetical protein